MGITLSDETVATVKATGPVVREHGLAITTRMYEILFAENPEVKSLFDAPGGVQEQRLAAAVIAYAENIDMIETLVPVVQSIAAKHVAKNVQPEHYDIVGDCLLRAMVEVLGPLDPAIISAWTEAYAFLASVFVETEAGMYADAVA